jgi:uncharacterized membrane protein YidH (DUF202 family)
VIRRAGRPDTPLRRRGPGAFLKRWTIPAIGAVTPLGLIAVNISIFVAKHLSEFRWAIAILAFISSLMLNSWAGLNIYRVFAQRRPDHPLVHERNQEMVLVAGMALVIALAFLTALFCFEGLANEADLPNALTFITGVVAILVPILLQALFRRGVGTRRRGVARGVTGVQSPPPPPATPTPPPLNDPVRRS